MLPALRIFRRVSAALLATGHVSDCLLDAPIPLIEAAIKYVRYDVLSIGYHAINERLLVPVWPSCMRHDAAWLANPEPFK